MRPLKLAAITLIGLSSILLALPASAEIRNCRDLFASDANSRPPNHALPWESARTQALLADTDLTRIPDSCGITSVYNVSQAALVTGGHKPFAQPSRMIYQLAEMMLAKRRRVGMMPEDIVYALRVLLSKRLKPHQFEVRAQVIKDSESTPIPDVEYINSITLETLAPRANELMVGSFVGFDRDGKPVGHHAMAIVGVKGKRLEVVDPADPYRRFFATAQGRYDALEGWEGDTEIFKYHTNLPAWWGSRKVHLIAPTAIVTVRILN